MSLFAAACTTSGGTPALLPPGLLARVPLPTDIVDAIAEVLECEAREDNHDARAALLARARSTLEAWLGGTVSTEGAIEALRAAAEPKSGIALRRI